MQANATFGTCDVPPTAPPPPAAAASGGDSQVPSNMASLDSKPVQLWWFLGAIPMMTLLL